MSPQRMTNSAMLAELKRQRAAIDAAIFALEALGGGEDSETRPRQYAPAPAGRKGVPPEEKVSSRRAQIRKIFEADSERVWTAPDLAKETDGDKADTRTTHTVGNVINKMWNKGEIERVGTGRYKLATPANSSALTVVRAEDSERTN